MKRAVVWLTLLFALPAGVLLLSFQAPQAPTDGSVWATYTRGVLHVSIPYAAPHEGAGTLSIEVDDPEDQGLARTERQVEVKAAKGTWQADLPFAKPLSTDDLIWHRLRYRFVYSGSNQPAIAGTDSISQILRRPVV